MSDLIRVIDLEVQAHIGVPDAERARAQKLLISLEMAVESFRPAAKADDVALTVDYHAVTEQVKRIVTQRQRKLLETLAEQIAADLLTNFAIEKITVEIKKFVLPDTAHVAVKIERLRQQAG